MSENEPLLVIIPAVSYSSVRWLTDHFKIAFPKVHACVERCEVEFERRMRWSMMTYGRLPDLIITTGRTSKDDDVDGEKIFYDEPVRFAEEHGIPLIHTFYGFKPRFIVRRQIRENIWLSSKFSALYA